MSDADITIEDKITALKGALRWREEVLALRAENARLREALEKIAELDGDGLASCTPQAIMKIARAALAKEEEEK
jgi:hypothetical protein